ncbi:hypothetical protein [Clostridium cellulovorans]|uniref:Uncharacterized protein n=1 Tax=Clostridium cellulovorans (strain ATCC 35296 / DSM 3052 / OCM 3 / 743B) TaxID=573061 RepID=D9SUK4_CLOC7|nr:hypothetical protein [Clostridium cellulovorans]ADL50909.1 hypothetical protein Clocel_1153 [Clostridium cellulovorans 743B]
MEEKILKNLNHKSLTIDNLIALYSDIWWNTPTTSQMPLPKKSSFDKKSNEKAFDSIIDQVMSMLSNFPKNLEERPFWKQNTIATFKRLIRTQPVLNLKYFDEYITDSFFKSTSSFVKESKTFDKDISFKDISQALRNMWIVNIFQNIFNSEIKFTSSSFGYSMLYPYTDNYLDDTNISTDVKKAFIKRLTKKIKGENVSTANSYEEKIFKLIDYIERNFSRKSYPKVYKGLLSINEGQRKSLIQQEQLSLPYERNILSVTIEKGGTSVLADGYLVRGDLNTEEETFAFGYGFILQLCDDLQDIKSDIENNNCTIFSQLAGNYPLDSLVNKLINLIITLLDNAECFAAPDVDGLKTLIKDNCLYLIIFAVTDNRKYFSKDYINFIEEFSPFTLIYMKNLKKKMNRKFKKLTSTLGDTSLDEIIMNLID